MKIFQLYFSGTGNTKWVAKTLRDKLIENHQEVVCYSIEKISTGEIKDIIKGFDYMVILHPGYGNDMPQILEDYLRKLLDKCKLPKSIKGIGIDVPALYSADGAQASRWYFDSQGVAFVGGYNVYLSCNFDTPIPCFKIASERTLKKMKIKALKKINTIARDIATVSTAIENCGTFNRIIGKLEQGPNRRMMENYEVKVNQKLCIGCKKCVHLCPQHNFVLNTESSVVDTKGNCTICLRCINHCPSYAIRFISSKGTAPYKQYKGPISGGKEKL